jgi:hypothetical protein
MVFGLVLGLVGTLLGVFLRQIPSEDRDSQELFFGVFLGAPDFEFGMRVPDYLHRDGFLVGTGCLPGKGPWRAASWLAVGQCATASRVDMTAKVAAAFLD